MKGQLRRYQFSLRSLFLLIFGVALVMPIALVEPLYVMWGIPFFAGALAGVRLARNRFWRTLLFGGMGGTIGLWVAAPLMFLHSQHYSFSQSAATLHREFDSLWVVIAVADSIVNFVMGAGVSAAVWCVQRIRTEVELRAVPAGRVTVYAVVFLLLLVNCLVYGFWMLAALGW
jgi:hypothetical protein